VGFAQHLDAHAVTGEPHAALRELITAHRRVAELCPPPFAATLILRASRLLNDRLNDERAAFDLLRAGSALLPLDENLYDNLLERGESTNRLDALDAHLARGVDEALDARTASSLLSRRARLLEGPLGRPDEAANVYVKLLQLRPDDMQATGKLRDSLRRARRFQDLLVVIHKQIQRAKGPEEKLELLKESAHVWELDLKNRWEALDAWRKVLELAPQDSEALRALARLDRRSLPSTGIVAIEPDAVRAALQPTSDDAAAQRDVPQAGRDDASSDESGSQPAVAVGDLPRVNLVTVDEVSAASAGDARAHLPAPQATPSQSPPSGVSRRGSRSGQPARDAAGRQASKLGEPKPRSSAPPRKH
jgi:tetratricopeptide (TPR) repeat protein